MAWAPVADVPFAVTGVLYFSPIIGVEFYVIDFGFNFYKCHIGTGSWTQLANPPFIGTNLYRQLTFRNGMLYCVDEGAGAEPLGRRISWYNPTTDIWASSSQAGALTQYQNIKSFCFADDDTIWAWVKRNFQVHFKCVRYVISTDTWTEFVNTTGVIGRGQARSAIMSADGAQVFGSYMSDAGGPGLSPGRFGIYTIATDTYTYSPFIVPMGPASWCWCGDPLRLWYIRYNLPELYRYSYLENDGVTMVLDYWLPNAARQAGVFGRFGVSNLRAIIDQASLANPMVYFDGAILPTVQTDPATEIT